MSVEDIRPRVAAIERARDTGASRAIVETMIVDLEKDVIEGVKRGRLDVISVMIASMPDHDRKSLMHEMGI